MALHQPKHQHCSLAGYKKPRGWLGSRLAREAVAQQLPGQQCVEKYGASRRLGIPQSEIPFAGRFGRYSREVRVENSTNVSTNDWPVGNVL